MQEITGARAAADRTDKLLSCQYLVLYLLLHRRALRIIRTYACVLLGTDAFSTLTQSIPLLMPSPLKNY